MIMARGLFAYPVKAVLNRTIPKNKIYAHVGPSRRVRDRFTQDVAQIVWQYKLAPETINLPARPGVPEIQIFSVALKSGVVTDFTTAGEIETDIFEDILRTIDKAISFPIIFELTAEDCVQVVAAYKRPNEADSTRWVVGDYYASDWHAIPQADATDTMRSPLPVALDLAGLYEQMLRKLMPTPAKPGESLQAQAERQSRLRQLAREYSKLEARLNREKQFNRKVELNRQLRQLKAELDSLSV